MHFLRRIKLHFLLKSLLPWNLAFESFYPVLPEYLSTQSFVLTSWLCSAPHQHKDFQESLFFFFYSTDYWRNWPTPLYLLHYFWYFGSDFFLLGGSDFFSDMFGESLGMLAGPPQPCHPPPFFKWKCLLKRSRKAQPHVTTRTSLFVASCLIFVVWLHYTTCGILVP